jgi:hypothetical protein
VSLTLIVPSLIEKINRLPVYIPEGRENTRGFETPTDISSEVSYIDRKRR